MPIGDSCPHPPDSWEPLIGGFRFMFCHQCKHALDEFGKHVDLSPKPAAPKELPQRVPLLRRLTTAS